MSSDLVARIAKQHNISRNKAKKLIEGAKDSISKKREEGMLNFRLRSKHDKYKNRFDIFEDEALI